MNLPKNLTIASPTKRFLAFVIDFVLAAVIGFLLYFFWGNKGLFTSLGGSEMWQQAMDFYGTSYLIEVEKDADGNWSTDYNELNYTVQPSSDQEKPGYVYYLDATYNFYSTFLTSNEHIDAVDDKAAKDYYGALYFNTEIIGLPKDLSSVNIEDPSTYTSADGYWQYDLNVAGTAIDQTAKPVVAKAYQTLVNAEDKEILTTYYKLFINVASSKEASGIFYDAAKLLSSQSYIKALNEDYTHVYWIINAVPFSIPLAAFFLLIPLCTPNGETLGNLITRTGYAGYKGMRINFWQRFGHPWIQVICLCPFVFVPSNYRMFAFMGAVVLLFVDFAFALRDKTGAYRSLEDRMCATILYEKKKSTLFKNEAEAEQFENDHNVITTVNNETIKVSDSEAILKEKSIIDLDILEHRDADQENGDNED